MKRGRSPSARSRPPVPTVASAPPSAGAPPLLAVVALAAAGAIAIAVSFRFFDYDLWEHLVAGKYLWTAHRIPTTQLWTWPTWGEPAMVPSWAFRALLWPFWQWGGEGGLAAWRILLALLTGACLFVAARRRGADPSIALALVVLCAVAWRGRTRVRPEGLAFVLFAAQLALLGGARGRLRDAGLVAIAIAWVNVHLSFFLGLASLFFHALGVSTRTARLRLLGVALAATAASLLNPYGWRGLVQPLDILLHHRAEPIYRLVAELGGIDPRIDVANGLLPLLVAWPVLLLLRARRRGFDFTETVLFLLLAAQTVVAQRFRGFFAIAAAVWVARDVTDVFLAPATGRARGASRRPLVVLAVIVAAAAWMRWGQPEFPPGFGLDWRAFPVRACDFLEAEGVRGRAFDHFWLGGYLEWRFWPDRGRLPFLDGHLESGSEHDRTLYALTQSDRDAWRRLDRERRFDYAVLDVRAAAGVPLVEALESDSAWAAVFLDDAAAVFVRRSSFPPIVAHFAYRHFRVSPAALDSVMNACVADTSLRRGVRSELERQVAGSPWTSVAHELLAVLDDMDGRTGEAGDERARAATARALHTLPTLSERSAPAEP